MCDNFFHWDFASNRLRRWYSYSTFMPQRGTMGAGRNYLTNLLQLLMVRLFFIPSKINIEDCGNNTKRHRQG